ncbi:MAG: hypothetical protein CL760_09560 [Chloroflexi bacterium]|nr:hypothetical protein [Chloroflexota bacterium]|tara:strand:- start:4463 stop:4903 length:441 start_codon:yes stop_codon:yes gene_type:complete
MIKIENHKDIESNVKSIIDSHNFDELACDDFKMSWQILKNACEQDNHSAFFVLPAVVNHLSKIQTKNRDFYDFINAVKEVNDATSEFVSNENPITLEDLKGMFGFAGLSFYIDRRNCADDISDELLEQVLQKVYTDNYLDLTLKEE